MEHASVKIMEMDHLQFLLDSEKWYNQGHLSPILDMMDMWGPCRNGGVKLGFFKDKKAWRAWFQAACKVVIDWEGFDDWNWEGFTDIRNMGINKLDVVDFCRLIICLLTFFIKTFVTRLSYYPSPMLCPPILAGHCCAKHGRKFATGLF